MQNRVLFITNAIAPYRIPLLNSFQNLISSDQFSVLFLQRKEEFRRWDIQENEIRFVYHVLPNWLRERFKIQNNNFSNFFVLFYLIIYHPGIVIVGGYDNLGYWLAWLYCQINGKSRLILYSGTTQLSTKKNHPVVKTLKKIFVKLCDAYITYGNWATEYLIELGAKPSHIVTGYNVGDVDYFSMTVDQLRTCKDFDRKRKKYAPCILITGGQLIPRKGFIESINSLSHLRRDDWELWVVGDGVLRYELERLAKDIAPGKVRFWGFLQRDQLAELYSISDIAIISSTSEVGSIILSEYLASGIYSIGSSFDASSNNLLMDSPNAGVIVDPKNTQELAVKIEESIQKHINGDISRDLVRSAIKDKNIQSYAAAFEMAVTKCR